MSTPLFDQALTPAEPPPGCPLEERPSLPSLGSLYLSALLKRRVGLKRDERIQKRGIGAPLTLTSEWLKSYLEICEWQQDGALVAPLTVGQVCAAHAQSFLLLGEHFPISPLGLVHASNEITAQEALPLDTPLWVRVWFGETEWRPRGVTIDLHTVISTQARRDQALWMGRTTAFKAHLPDQEAIQAQRAQPRAPQVALSTQQGASAPLPLPLGADMGRRYAPIARDRNPIHLYPWSARLFGFKRPIMHGMWSLARSLSYATPSAQDASVGSLQVHFKRPIELPSTPTLTLCPEHEAEGLRDAHFEVRTARDQLAMEGAWRLG